MLNTFSFARLPFSRKILISGFVIILASGYLAAVLNTALSVGISPQAIADHYADKSLSSEESAAIDEKGFVEEEFSFDDEDNMSDITMEGMNRSQTDMNMSMDGGDDTLPAKILAQVSHVHLLSFSLLLITMGGLLCLTQLAESIKVAVVSLLFLSLWGDIISLNLVRFVSSSFSYMTVATGTIIGLCLVFISFIVFWELWLVKPAE